MPRLVFRGFDFEAAAPLRYIEQVQRRGHGRYRIWFPVKVSTGQLRDALAVSHNVSAGGMLVALSAKLEPGEAISISFHLPPDGGEERTVKGRITRIEDNTEDPDGVWPYRVAVEFEGLAPELVPLFEAAAYRLSHIG